jgi:PTS system nitrogen regulatory IIA component
MQLAELLAPGDVLLDLRAGDKKQVLQELARRAAPRAGIDAPAIAAALQSREQLGSTGLGKGFALPHARMRGLAGFIGLFVRLERAIDFQSIDAQPVDLVFLLLIPENAGNAHVAALAAVSRKLRDPAVVRALRKATSAAVAYDLLAA